MHKVIKLLTDFDQRARKAVDYTAGVLLYDNFDRLRNIAGSNVDVEKRQML